MTNLAVNAIANCLASTPDSAAWPATFTRELAARAEAILAERNWAATVTAGLSSPNRRTRWRAALAARRLGIDAFSYHVASIHADPLRGDWFEAWLLTDDDRAKTLANLAEMQLDLDAIATGPGTSLGLGPGYEQHFVIDQILQFLHGYPGVGGRLIAAALLSPVIRDRHGAIGVLRAWGPSQWSTEHTSRLRALAESDPDDDIRAAAQEALSAIPD